MLLIALNIVVFAPLLSFVTISVVGRKIGVYGSMWVSCFNLVVTLAVATYLFFIHSFTTSAVCDLWTWATLNSLTIPFSLRYDSLTATMFFVVSLVSTCVHIYSCVYMYTDPFLSRFLAYLSLFTFFMLLLVASNNFLVLFMGWEGVGLCSYLLIGFWYTRAQAGKAATKAFLINKVGDLFLLSGIVIIFMVFHTLDFSVVSLMASSQPSDALAIIAVFLFVGAIGKSAQIGLHTWLPDAMEGPTPVSALIHAATMVTAGVFLLNRCSFLLEHTPRLLFWVAVLGGLTALVSGTIGSVQNDIKKIIAYSTCSQLGYMVLACGLSNYSAGFFHLFNHAFFKALLFLSAGSIIHLLSGEQDIRKMGGVAALSPFIYSSVLVASLALAGFPFTAGFYSKDFIIEAAVTKFWVSGQFLYWLAITAAALTATYSFRLLDQVFWAHFIGFKNVIARHAKITLVEVGVLGVLGCLSLFTGYHFKDVFIGAGASFFSSITYVLPTTWVAVEIEFLPFVIRLLPTLLALVAFQLEGRFLECKWFYNELLIGYIALPALQLGRHMFEQYEKNGLEANGPLFISAVITKALQLDKRPIATLKPKK